MRPLNRRVQVISHRACLGHAPENTLAGIRIALEFGVDAIEVDVRSTADGVPVLLHDAALDRTTNLTGNVEAMSVAEVRKADAGGEPVPLLAEALALVGAKTRLLIEVKQPGIEHLIVDVVRNAWAGGSVMFCSFLPEAVRRLRELVPDDPTFQLYGPDDGPIDPSHPVFVHYSLITRALVVSVQSHGQPIYGWTVDEEPEMRRLAALGVDGICSNYPDRLLRVVRPA